MWQRCLILSHYWHCQPNSIGTTGIKSIPANLMVGCVPWNFLPEIHVPLNFKYWNSWLKMSSNSNRVPFTLGPSSGGVSSTTDVTISDSTTTMTSRAIKMPLQFLWVVLVETSWNKKKTTVTWLLWQLQGGSICQNIALEILFRSPCMIMWRTYQIPELFSTKCNGSELKCDFDTFQFNSL